MDLNIKSTKKQEQAEERKMYCQKCGEPIRRGIQILAIKMAGKVMKNVL